MDSAKLKLKLSSRKFWAAVLSFVGMICVAIGFSDMSTERVIAVISSFSVLVIYIVGETIVDTSRDNTTTEVVENVKIDWVTKLTSRKFWAALLGFIVTLLVSLGCDTMTTERVTAIISAVATLAVYILGESVIDSSNASAAESAIDEAMKKAEELEETLKTTSVIPTKTEEEKSEE